MNKPKVYKVLALYPDGELISPQIEATSYQGEREIILRYKEGELTCNPHDEKGIRTWASKELGIAEANTAQEKGAALVIHEATPFGEELTPDFYSAILLGKEVWRIP